MPTIIGTLGNPWMIYQKKKRKQPMSRNNLIGLISANVAFWAIVLFIGSAFTWEFPPFSTEDNTFRPSMLWGNFFNALVLYLNALWLYPHFKKKRLKLPYWLCVLLLIISTAVIEALIDFRLVEYMGLMDRIDEEYQELLFSIETGVIIDWTITNLFVHGFYFLFSFGLVFLINSVTDHDQAITLEQEKQVAELKFLKAQINPHFLFNGINSVYHLIDEKPAIAKDTLLKFSNLLRYQLYECNDDLIPLEKELAHIRDYVEMEKIRKGEDVTIQLELPEEVFNIKIPPLFFTPFIENAFKYVSNYEKGEDNQIHIKVRLYLEQGKLWFEATNTIDKSVNRLIGGIGITNVKKRLDLLFPNQHDLVINKNTERFTVGLSLNLK